MAGAPPPSRSTSSSAPTPPPRSPSPGPPRHGPHPRLRVGLADGGYGREVPAEERVYTEALTGEIVHTYHASLAGLPPDTAFGYQVVHDGADPVAGTFRTGPRGRGNRFRFTSLGDHSNRPPSGAGSALTRLTLATSSMPSTRSIPCFT